MEVKNIDMLFKLKSGTCNLQSVNSITVKDNSVSIKCSGHSSSAIIKLPYLNAITCNGKRINFPNKTRSSTKSKKIQEFLKKI